MPTAQHTFPHLTQHFQTPPTPLPTSFLSTPLSTLFHISPYLPHTPTHLLTPLPTPPTSPPTFPTPQHIFPLLPLPPPHPNTLVPKLPHISPTSQHNFPTPLPNTSPHPPVSCHSLTPTLTFQHTYTPTPYLHSNILSHALPNTSPHPPQICQLPFPHTPTHFSTPLLNTFPHLSPTSNTLCHTFPTPPHFSPHFPLFSPHPNTLSHTFPTAHTYSQIQNLLFVVDSWRSKKYNSK